MSKKFGSGIIENIIKDVFKYNEFIKGIDTSQKYIAITGKIQSGKTKTLMEYAFRCLSLNKNVIVALRNSCDDLKTFLERGKRFVRIACINRDIKDEKIIKKIFSRIFVNVKAETVENLEEKMENYMPKIYVVNSHVSHFKNKINPLLEGLSGEFGIKEFVLIVDESDALSVMSDSLITSVQIIDELNTTADYVSQYVRLTATPYAHLFIREKIPLKCMCIYELLPCENYVSYGHEKFILKPLEHNLYMKNSKIDDYNKDYMYDIIYSEILRIRRAYNRFVVGYINLGRLKSVHEKVAELIKEEFSEVTFINIYDGSITVDYSEEFLNKKEKLKRSRESVQKNLEYIQKESEDGVYNHTLVIILGRNQLGRGVSLRSEVDNFKSYRDIVFCDFTIIDVSDKMECDSMSQMVLRAGGVFKGIDKDFDGINIYTSQDVIDNLENTDKWYNESMKAIRSIDDSQIRTYEMVESMNYKPTRLLSKYQDKYHKSKITGERIFVNMRTLIKTLDIIKDNNDDNDDNEMSSIEKDFIKWSNKLCNTKISNLMKSIDPEYIYTRDEFNKLMDDIGLKGDVRLSNLNKKHKNHGYGELFQITESNVCIYPHLIEIHKKYFN